MKKSFIFTITLLLSYNLNILTKPKKPYHKLHSEVIEFLDGQAGSLDGNAILEIQQVRKRIVELRESGVKDPKTNKFLQYKGSACAIEKIAIHETSIPNCPELRNCLMQAKEIFISLTLPFMKRIQGAKHMIIQLMKESCKLRKIKESETILLEWGNTKGNEREVFNAKIKTFKEFDKFLNHVSDFLGDLAQSCPKGLKQYNEKIGKRT